jgi:hypothetical protein
VNRAQAPSAAQSRGILQCHYRSCRWLWSWDPRDSEPAFYQIRGLLEFGLAGLSTVMRFIKASYLGLYIFNATIGLYCARMRDGGRIEIED